MAELPIAIVAGRRVYDNTPTTVFVLATNAAGKLLVIRRATQPGYGLLGLPGGYQMRGETWQEAGARELLEETGCHLHPSSLQFVSIRTDEYCNNLIIARSQRPVSVECERDKESLDVYLSNEIGGQDDWAHRDLYFAAASLVAELEKLQAPQRAPAAQSA
jgi:8-oxo-dGTP pyrophosphatase MutT (NUDIX family)